ncbi:uncharacterized protein LOC131210611 [Anopheles bellator]|uniref:uncharacterized protein LOC131210611 n=1 Tax=Anopheles bellator TaxID=139047 RepID=UPI00264965B8|nr:uncharacterized protein LOC131210611 [Anopheles bellator]XP_058059869.1 uncharacterized protein LOC131210611 [Anopheles bellator]
MVKQKRKAQPATAGRPAVAANESDGSDYEVEWQLKPTPAKLTKAEAFPLPAKVERNLKKSARGGQPDSSSEESDDDDVPGGGKQLPTLTTAQIGAILETTKNNKRFVLLVKNLSYTTSKEEIEAHFGEAGNVKGVRIPKRRGPRIAFVQMVDSVGFQKAFLLDGSTLDGREINVNLSESGNKKSQARLSLLQKKNEEIRKLRKKNRHNVKATKISLKPDLNSSQPKPPPPKDRFLDKPRTKWLTKKEVKGLKRDTSLKAKFKNISRKGIKA